MRLLPDGGAPAQYDSINLRCGLSSGVRMLS